MKGYRGPLRTTEPTAAQIPMTEPCRPTRTLEEIEPQIIAESELKGIDPAEHPARNWLHCRCGTWHKAGFFKAMAENEPRR